MILDVIIPYGATAWKGFFPFPLLQMILDQVYTLVVTCDPKFLSRYIYSKRVGRALYGVTAAKASYCPQLPICLGPINFIWIRYYQNTAQIGKNKDLKRIALKVKRQITLGVPQFPLWVHTTKNGGHHRNQGIPHWILIHVWAMICTFIVSKWTFLIFGCKLTQVVT